ncbi:MAG: ABC transporter substrate-binding protein [Acidimicrobiales bacterium]
MVDRARLSLFCPTCLPGYHLPFFTGVTQGVFAEYGMAVDIIDPPPPPGGANSRRVADGGAEFALTGITYHLQALEEAGGEMGARFVAVIHQRSPLAAIVPVESDITDPAHLAGCRVGRGEHTGWLADELGQVLDDRGLGQPEYVPLDHGDAPYALGRGEIDVVATMVDAMVGVGRKGDRPVRAVALGPDLYSSGLVAADSVSDDVVRRMRAAVAASFELQRLNPASAVAEYTARFTDVDPEAALASWRLLEEFAFFEADTGPDAAAASRRPVHQVGDMDASRWERTLRWIEGAHGLGPNRLDAVIRPSMAAGTVSPGTPASAMASPSAA